MKVVISGQYAILSRGKICAKHIPSKTWADAYDGRVILDKPGKWMISQNDGYQRKETCYVEVDTKGNVTNLGSRMWLVTTASK